MSWIRREVLPMDGVMMTGVLILSLALSLVQHGAHAANKCAFNQTDTQWSLSCNCVGLELIQVECRDASIGVFPALPPLVNDQIKIVSVVIKAGVAHVQQDTFKEHGHISHISLDGNNLNALNVNAFRGLQQSLSKLSVQHNYLTSVPATSLLYLHNLHYLQLQHNRVTQVKSYTFEQTQLHNLKYLHLDHNLIGDLPKEALGGVDLAVLTVSNNRISRIDPTALSNSIWFLNLGDNELDEVPYPAIANLSSLQRLVLSGNRIRNLNGHNAAKLLFKQRMYLDLSNNRITFMDPGAFINFRGFTKLDISFNDLAYIPVEMCQPLNHLEELDLSHNVISSIPASTLSPVSHSLWRVNLRHNQLHTLPDALASLTQLEVLDLEYNKLTTISVNELKFRGSLKHLYLGYNSIIQVPTHALNGMIKLETLDLSQNRIKSLPNMAFGMFEGLDSSLTELRLAGNQIADLDHPGSFMYMSNLVYLDISHNKIINLVPNVFSRLVSLISLSLTANRLSRFPGDAVRANARLKMLRVDHNAIIAISDHSMPVLPYLAHLTLASNRLTAIPINVFTPEKIPQLVTLDLSQNQIAHISGHAFDGLSQLVVLNLAVNRISVLDAYTFANLSALVQLKLDDNNIDTIHHLALKDLPSLHYLDLSNNRIGRLNKGILLNVPALESVSLAQNHLITFDGSWLDTHEVTSLDLSYNRIASADLSAFRRALQFIDLSHNELKEITREHLNGFEQLRTANMSSNGLTSVHPAAFKGCLSLTYVSLATNHLSIIQKATFAHQPMLSTVDLSSNSLHTLEPGSFGENNCRCLILANNKLTHVPYAALDTIKASLNSLDLSSNRLTVIQSLHFDGLQNLTRLVLSYNLINTIEEAAFEALGRLVYLDLSHNPVSTWHPQAFRDISHSISSLNLAGTGLFSMPSIGTRAITNLNISHNQIYTITLEDMKPLSEIETLDLSNNQLKEIPNGLLDSLHALTHLNISDNRLEILNDQHLRCLHSVHTLYMHSLPLLAHLPQPESFRHMRNLRTLKLYQVPALRMLNVSKTLENLPPLRSLHIEITEPELSNQLHTADFRFMSELTISGRSLKRIHPLAFHKLRGYAFKLTVTATEITDFPSGILYSLNQIKLLHLDLSNNMLNTFKPFAHLEGYTFVNHHGTSLVDVDLSENLLECGNCALSWVSPWLQHMQMTLTKQQFLDKVVAWSRTKCNDGGRTPVTTIDYNSVGCYDSVKLQGVMSDAIGVQSPSPSVSWMSLVLINFALVVHSLQTLLSIIVVL